MDPVLTLLTVDQTMFMTIFMLIEKICQIIFQIIFQRMIVILTNNFRVMATILCIYDDFIFVFDLVWDQKLDRRKNRLVEMGA